jgi:general secretion pathway protein H
MISRRNLLATLVIGEGGFTLIEMLVIVAILAFSLVLIAGYRPPWSRGFDIEATAAELAGQLRLVRSEAIAGNRSEGLQLDLAHHLYRAGSAAKPRSLPPALGVQLVTITNERHSQNIGDIRFNPDGSSTGGRIVLADGARRVAVGVDWLTGRVSVVDVK